MTVYEHAAQIWSILALAGRNRQVLTYDIVGRLIGVPRYGLGRHLEPIQSYCLVHDLPPLTSLVVSETTGLPSPGFTAAADVPREQIRVMAFDWLAHPAPTPEVLEQAVQQHPSNGVAAAQPNDTEPVETAVQPLE
jgi:hypothetical protein